MSEKQHNYAFIDSQNMNLGIRAQGWHIDYKKFRQYLANELNVTKAYMFFGFMEDQQDLYMALQDAGFILVFKPMVSAKDGEAKGNCDAEVVLQAMIDYNHYDKAVIVTGDGDFACLVRHLLKNKKLEMLLIPNQQKYSSLLRSIDESANDDILVYMNALRGQLTYRRTNGSSRLSDGQGKGKQASSAPKSAAKPASKESEPKSPVANKPVSKPRGPRSAKPATNKGAPKPITRKPAPRKRFPSKSELEQRLIDQVNG